MKLLIAFMSAVMCLLATPLGAEEQTDDPAEILRTFRTIQLETRLAKPKVCDKAFKRHEEFSDWGVTLLRRSASGWDFVAGDFYALPILPLAQLDLTVDHRPDGPYHYQLTHPTTGVELAAGNIVEQNGQAACRKVAEEIVEKIKSARPPSLKRLLSKEKGGVYDNRFFAWLCVVISFTD